MKIEITLGKRPYMTQPFGCRFGCDPKCSFVERIGKSEEGRLGKGIRVSLHDGLIVFVTIVLVILCKNHWY